MPSMTVQRSLLSDYRNGPGMDESKGPSDKAMLRCPHCDQHFYSDTAYAEGGEIAADDINVNDDGESASDGEPGYERDRDEMDVAMKKTDYYAQRAFAGGKRGHGRSAEAGDNRYGPGFAKGGEVDDSEVRAGIKKHFERGKHQWMRGDVNGAKEMRSAGDVAKDLSRPDRPRSSGIGNLHAPGYAKGGEMKARFMRRADKGGESGDDDSFAGSLAKRKKMRAMMGRK